MKTICLGVILIGAALAGCTPTASIIYREIKAPDTAGMNKFTFQGSIINITQASNNGTRTPGQYTFTAVPVSEPSGKVYGISDASGLGVTTQVSLTHRTNTSLISSIGTSVQDNRVKDIGTIASIVAGAVALAAAQAGGPAVKTPLVANIDVSKIHLTADNDSSNQVVITDGVLNGALGYTITYSPVSPDAVPFASMPLNTPQSILYYSACRMATISFVDPDDQDKKLVVNGSVQISDPNFLETIKLPLSGSVTLDNGCGASSSNSTSSVSSLLDVANALLSAGTSIRNAEQQKSTSNQTK